MKNRKLLPTLFRARPIASYLPAWPRSPLPQSSDLALDTWQPLLPGGYQSIITGARPGILFIVREHLQTQNVDPVQPSNNLVVVSGAVPCQHRMPRPVRIPDYPPPTPPATPNPDQALRTWGTYFDALETSFDGRNLMVTSDPTDSGFLVLDSGPVGIVLTLVGAPSTAAAIAQGTIPPHWDGRLAFQETSFSSAQIDWVYTAQLIDGDTAIALTANILYPSDSITSSSGSANPGNAIDQNLNTIFTTPSGDKLTITPAVGASVVTALAITNLLTGSPSSTDPTGYTLSGSNDGTPFQQIATGSIGGFDLPGQTQTTRFANSTSYKSYELVLTNVSGAIRVAEIQLLQLPSFHGDADAIQTWQASKAHSSTATVLVSVSGPNGKTQQVKNFHQTLSFPLRVAVAGQDPLPLQPVFVLFEDPEYNRLLASTTARASASFKQGASTCTVSFATDRREYNATGAINYLFYLEPNPVPDSSIARGQGLLKIRNVNAEGVQSIALITTSLTLNALPADPGLLDILSIRRGNQPNAPAAPLFPGDKLQFELTVTDPGGTVLASITLLVDIVAEPVTPALESGFALLRGGSSGTVPVECARFAWGPQPERIELVSPDDLMHEIVRRRAVFHWSDTIRIGRKVSYAIQKIAPFGSTHFPTLHNLPEPTKGAR